MKIINVKTYIVDVPPPHRGGSRWIFLKLITDEGLEGVGECTYHGRLNNVYVELIKDLGKRFVIGANPFQIERLWWNIYEGQGVRHSGPIITPVLSAFEMACWDIVGKASNQPIYNLLGGMFHDKLRAYSYLSEWGLGHSPEKTAELALKYVEKGFTAVKLDPVGGQPHRLEVLRYAENVIKAIRDAVGDKCDILIGTHGQFTTHSAIRFAKRVEDYDPLWFEEPVPPENIKEMARVAQSTSIPIATGERLLTKFEFATLLELQAASILQMDLTITGGILEAKKIAGMAEAHYAHIAPHLWGGPIGGAANIQLDVCSPNFLIQEGIDTLGGFHAEILKEPIKWENGYIIPPSKPGLGVELNEEVLSKYAIIQNVS
ncbi:MAG: mandelate racemase/muconate lactonizing enzyme family protein [Candidatus Poribacteria bacterium]